MLSRKLLRPLGRNIENERTVVVALGNFICNFNSTATWPRNSTSFCSSRLISSQSRCDEDWKKPVCHAFRQNRTNMGSTFITNASLLNPTMCRKLHTSFQPIAAHLVTPPTTVLHKNMIVLTTSGFRERAKCWTPHQRLFSSKGKDDQSESNNNPNDSKTGSERPNSDLPISTITIKDGLRTTAAVSEFLGHLSEEQKGILYHSLNVVVLRDKYEGHLGSSKSESHHYLSKFGRPTASIGEEPTGTLCEIPPKWLHTRLDEKLHPPTASAIWAVGIKNALPFIGFGFLDNLIMILAGDYIDVTIGTTLGISTMAAAALGNTISDVAGIGSAWYVEELANKVGIKDPQLTPSQFASWSIRWASNGGRAIGVVIGCLLGMVPLIFLPSPEEKEKEAKAKAESVMGNASSATDDLSKKDKTKN